MFFGPLGDFSRRKEHARVQAAALVFEVQPFLPATRRVRHETDRQDEIDNIHASTSNPDRTACGKQEQTSLVRLLKVPE
jgi:hypothetical protein